jgi:hypothetical protein
LCSVAVCVQIYRSGDFRSCGFTLSEEICQIEFPLGLILGEDTHIGLSWCRTLGPSIIINAETSLARLAVEKAEFDLHLNVKPRNERILSLCV